jgi:FAD/FMN-containing dehydrogenase
VTLGRQGPVLAPLGFRGVFRTDEASRAVYSEAAGIQRVMPLAVAVPSTVDDVVTLMGWAESSGVSLVPRGSGSSMAGGAVGPGVIVDLHRLDTLAKVNARTATIQVGAAVVRDRVERAALEAGFVFPVDPSSGAFATIGGMCATNAAGARSVKYGAMRKWVRALDVVLADGTFARFARGEAPPKVPAVTRFKDDVVPRLLDVPLDLLRHDGVRKESSAYALAAYRESGDLLDLFIGSEGTLGIIVGAELQLLPIPAATAGLLAGFPDLEGAAAAAVRLAEAGASAVELLDRSFIEIAASTGDPLPVELPRNLEAVLIVEVEADTEHAAVAALRSLVGWCEAGGATHIVRAVEPHEESQLWQLRHAASPILNKLAPRLQSLQLVEDGCVPPAKLAEYVRGVRRALLETRLRGVIFGHAGDGHVHVNALVDFSEIDWRARVDQLLQTVTSLIVAAGGTLSGEHGDGRLRAPLLAKVWPPETLTLCKYVKRAFDPDGVLNPGVILPAPGAQAIEQVKYDPSLPPLPAKAREALDTVVKTKGYAKHRLDLLA